MPSRKRADERLGSALDRSGRDDQDPRRPGGEAVAAERPVLGQPAPGERVLLGAGRVEAVRHGAGSVDAAVRVGVADRQPLPDGAFKVERLG